MTQFAQSNRATLVLAPEVTWGVLPPATAFRQLRFTGETIDLDKQTARSEVIRPDRMSDSLSFLGYSTSGDVSGELSYGDWDDLMAAALANTWTTGDFAGVSLTVSAAAKTITRAAGSFVTDGVLPGTLIKTSLFINAGNNGPFYVASVTPLVITVLDNIPSTLVNETQAAGHYHFEYLTNGVATPSFSIEKQFQDVGEFAQATGQRVSTFELDVTAMQRITLKFGFMGKSLAPSGVTATGSVTAPGVNPSMTASVNVAQLLVNGAPVSTGVKSTKITIENNLRKQDVIASQAVGGLGYGTFDVKGSSEVYFSDISLWQDVVNHATIAQFFKTVDASGNCYGFNIPAMNFLKGSGKIAKANEDVTLPLEFEGSRDPVTNAMFVVSRVSMP